MVEFRLESFAVLGGRRYAVLIGHDFNHIHVNVIGVAIDQGKCNAQYHSAGKDPERCFAKVFFHELPPGGTQDVKLKTAVGTKRSL